MVPLRWEAYEHVKELMGGLVCCGGSRSMAHSLWTWGQPSVKSAAGAG